MVPLRLYQRIISNDTNQTFPRGQITRHRESTQVTKQLREHFGETQRKPRGSKRCKNFSENEVHFLGGLQPRKGSAKRNDFGPRIARKEKSVQPWHYRDL